MRGSRWGGSRFDTLEQSVKPCSGVFPVSLHNNYTCTLLFTFVNVKETCEMRYTWEHDLVRL